MASRGWIKPSRSKTAPVPSPRLSVSTKGASTPSFVVRALARVGPNGLKPARQTKRTNLSTKGTKPMWTEQMSQGLSLAAAPVHPQSVAVGTADTGGVDLQKFRRVMFIIDVGSVGAAGTVDAKLQESTDNATFTDLAGTGVAITQITTSNKLATLEARAGQLSAGKRYAR